MTKSVRKRIGWDTEYRVYWKNSYRAVRWPAQRQLERAAKQRVLLPVQRELWHILRRIVVHKLTGRWLERARG